MQLDRTTIAIRQRSMLDLIDLSLVLFRNYWRPLIGWAVVGVLPFLAINQWILRGMLDYETIMVEGVGEVEVSVLRMRYQFHSMVLVFLEAPLAMLAVTYYLGQAVFVDHPSTSEVWKTIRAEWRKSVWILGVLRGGFLGIVAVGFANLKTEAGPFIEVFVIGFCLWIGIGLLRGLRPFAPEIIVLEQSPLRTGKDPNSSVSYSLRGQQLHSMMSGDLFARMLFFSLALFVGWTVLSMVERFVVGVIFGQWQIGWWDDWIGTPMNLWFLALIATVFRFLSYLDTRIRTEGWELKLRMQAEAMRLEMTH